LVGQSEVDQLHTQVLLRIHHEVLGLQVTMRYFLGVQVFDDFNYLREDLTRVLLVEVAPPVQTLEQLAAFAVTKSAGTYSITR
jgi:hypothetical protein